MLIVVLHDDVVLGQLLEDISQRQPGKLGQRDRANRDVQIPRGQVLIARAFTKIRQFYRPTQFLL